MKKTIPAIVVVLIVSSCLPISLPGFATPTALIQPTGTSSTESTPTPPPTGTPVLAPTTINSTSNPPTVVNTDTASPPNLTSTLATSTDLPVNPSITPPQTTLLPGQPTLTPTLGILKYGTLPPEVPFNSITLWNRSKAQAYISLQVTLNDGRFSIIEYPVAGQVRIKAPLGSYVYVAWVGGNKMVGSFRLTSSNSLVIILYKDKVVIK